MKSKEEEYRELFMTEAVENFEELNKLFTILEKNHKDTKVIDSIFRITHTLKGNAMGMSFDGIAALAHTMEDVMGAVKNATLELSSDLFEVLFRANDKLGDLIQALETGAVVRYEGVRARLSLILEKQSKDPGEKAEQETPPEQIQEEEDVEEEQTQSSDQIQFAEVIHMPIKRMDELMNLVGQLMIERDRLISFYEGADGRATEFEGLKRITSNLQYHIMKARMVQVGFLFNKFHRIVRDVAKIENKSINLELKGTEIEIDRNILKIMSDSLVHLVRNAVSHGIESEAVRLERGKSASGNIVMDAWYEKDNVVISISDDGNGIDVNAIRKKIIEKKMISKALAADLTEDQIIQYIFQAGFSNKDTVTEVSGRGVGMDVVKRAVESIGGQIMVNTELGKGSSFILMLPSSLALKGALLFELYDQPYAIPLSYTEAVVSIQGKDVHKVGRSLMTKYLDSSISLIFLEDLTNMADLALVSEKGVLFKSYQDTAEDDFLSVVIVKHSGKLIGLVVHKLLQQKEIIEKVLPRPISNNKLLSGSAILGNGQLCLVLDVSAISSILFKSLLNQDSTGKNK